jgi:hypothetical protein
MGPIVAIPEPAMRRLLYAQRAERAGALMLNLVLVHIAWQCPN